MAGAMWVWSKLSAAKWEDAWEERFHGKANAVLTRLKGGKRVRVDVYCRAQREAEEIAAQFGGTVRMLPDKDWVAISAQAGPPVRIRDCLLITEERRAAELRKLRRENPGREVVSIPPEMAFGTGDHPTTAACLRLLADEARARRGGRWRMLDLGCGSGVLAIAARRLGAAECEALDYDPSAVAVARRNVERNDAAEVRVEEADLLHWRPRRRYEVVAANLFAEVLKAAFPRIRKALGPESSLILSGVLRAQWPEVEAAAAAAGVTMEEVRRNGKWISARGWLAGGTAGR